MKTVYEIAVDKINELLPFDGFVDVHEIDVDDHHNGHAIKLIGEDKEGFKLTKEYWRACNNLTCPISQPDDIPLMSDEVADILSESEKEYKQRHLTKILDNLNGLSVVAKLDPEGFIGGVFSYKCLQYGSVDWRKFLVTEVVNPVFPAVFRGVSMDSDKEMADITVSLLDILPPVGEVDYELKQYLV